MAKEQVSSILRALQILECFMDRETEWTLKALVDHLDMPSTTVFRQVSTLAERQYLVQDPVRKSYRVGPRLMLLASAILGQSDLRRVARPELEHLSDTVHETINLSVLLEHDIFYLYGELKNSRKLASVIVKARATQRIATIGEFLEIVKPLFGREREKKELAKVFQALRIEVNQEMEALKEMLYAATEALKPGGRLVVITYHSLEDRMVKNIMKTGNVEGKAEKDFFGNVLTPFRLVNNKVIVPDEEEIERNPRSRSAKLRIAERVTND